MNTVMESLMNQAHYVDNTDDTVGYTRAELPNQELFGSKLS